MLIAFIAIVKDCFRAAIASRVLYVLLAVITLLLVVIAPLHIRESLDWKIDAGQHIPDEVALSLKLFEGSKPDARPGLKLLWEGLSDETRLAITEVGEAEDPNDAGFLNTGGGPADPLPIRVKLLRGLQTDLNAIIEGDSLADNESWGKLTGEAEELAGRGVANLGKTELKRLNRLLITSELSPLLSPADQASLETWYAIWQFQWATVSGSRTTFARGLLDVVNYIFDKFVLSIGLMIAIIVTSTMIPDMFEAGSLNLLLSKPVPRWLLLTGKFVGACAFIALCSTYLFLGLWLWMGLAVGLWDRGLLYCIPLYMVVFAIYYSVSMLVGIVYRSPIVSVILTVLFWAVCFGVGSVWGLFETRTRNDRMVDATVVGEKVFAVDCQQRLWRLDSKGSWEETVGHSYFAPEQAVAMGIVQFMAPLSGEVIGPVETMDGKYLLVGTPQIFDPEPRRGVVPMNLHAIDVEEGKSANLGALPQGSLSLNETIGEPVLVNSNGEVFRLDRERLAARMAEVNKPSNEEPAVTNVSNGKKEVVKSEKADELFVREKVDGNRSVRETSRVTYDKSLDCLLILYRDQLVRINHAPQEGWARTSETKIDVGSPGRDMPGWLQAAEGMAVVAWGTGRIVLFDLNKMEPLPVDFPVRTEGISTVRLAPDGGSLVVIYRDGRAFTAARQGDWEMKSLAVGRGGRVDGASFENAGELLVTHSIDRVSRLDMVSGQLTTVASPNRNFIQKLHLYIIDPFYRIAPKPGEFYKLVSYLSATSPDENSSEEIDRTKLQLANSPWGPLWSGLGFMGVMLGLSCLIFTRQDY